VQAFESLVEMLRAWLRAEPMPPLAEAAWPLAQAHRLGGLVHALQPPMEAATARAAATAWLKQSARTLHLARAFAAHWPPDAPAPLVLKGFDVLENLLRDPGARRVSDLDLLLPDPAWAELVARWRPLADEVRTPRGERHAAESPYELGFVFDGALLELHRHPQPHHRGGPSGHSLALDAVPGRLEGLPVLYPSPEGRLLLWLVNQVKGSFHTDLTDVVDLVLALRALSGPGAMARVGELARACGLETAWPLALARARWLLPELPLEGLAATAPFSPLASWMPALAPTPAHPSALRFQAMKFALTSPAHRLGLVARGLTATFRARR